jgi:hypothetical protein
MGRQRPKSVAQATWVQWAVVLVAAVTVALTAILRDDLVLAWARNNQAAQVVLAEGGLKALRDSSITTPSFVPVAIVAFVVFALLAWVLLALFRSGHQWARLSLCALAVFSVLAFVVIYRQSPPLPFTLLGVVAVLLDLALLFFLWHPDTNAFIRGAEIAAERETEADSGSSAGSTA